MKVYEMYNMYQKFCWQIYRQISQKTEMIMKKVPVKVFYVGLFLHRFDVYPKRIANIRLTWENKVTDTQVMKQ